MPLRRDALTAAAVMISAIERRAQAEPELVATVGRLEIAHPAANIVPGAARFTLDSSPRRQHGEGCTHPHAKFDPAEKRGSLMKRISGLVAALVGAMSVSACQTSQQQTGTLAGGAIGAGSGALIGSAVSGGSAGGAIAGGVIGAGTGALIGNAGTAPPPGRCAKWSYDYNGNRVCTAFY
jgi:hypothetical protein